jgi:arylsulfatase A-like enzyme
VPGVLFCNRTIEAASPRLLDVAPTVLDLFGVPIPDYMDGKPWTVGEKKQPQVKVIHQPAEPVPQVA